VKSSNHTNVVAIAPSKFTSFGDSPSTTTKEE